MTAILHTSDDRYTAHICTILHTYCTQAMTAILHTFAYVCTHLHMVLGTIFDGVKIDL